MKNLFFSALFLSVSLTAMASSTIDIRSANSIECRSNARGGFVFNDLSSNSPTITSQRKLPIKITSVKMKEFSYIVNLNGHRDIKTTISFDKKVKSDLLGVFIYHGRLSSNTGPDIAVECIIN